MFETSAELVELIDSQTIRLRSADGREFPVKLEQLSAADQQYVANFVKANSTQASNGPKTAVALESLAKSCATAREAVAFYEAFFADPTVLSSEKEAARPKLQSWQSLAATDSVRAGFSWIAGGDLPRMKVEARDQIRQGLEFLRLNNGDLARDCFERASKADLTSNDADFIMGLVYAMAVRDLNKAEKHFRECIKRDPVDVPALNNLSLIELKQRNYQDAAEILRQASLSSPRTAYLSQNMGRLIDQAGKRRIAVSPAMQTEAGGIYSRLIDLGSIPFEPTKGWLYMLPRRSAADQPADSDTELITTGGAGMIVAPHYVLTPYAALGRSASCLILKKGPDGRDELVPAEIVDIPNERSLALLRCPQLEGPAVSFATLQAAMAVDVAIFGYSTLLGRTIEASSAKGSLLPMPAAYDGRVVFSQEKEVSVLGGPVCDMKGNVIAVHIGNYLGGKLGAGISAADVTAFLERNVPDYVPAAVVDRVVGWSGVDARIRPSTVVVFRNEKLMQPADLGIKAVGDGTLEDIACAQCFGLGKVECPLRACNRGSVMVTVSKVIGKDPVTGLNITSDFKNQVKCDVCSGAGRVSCRLCNGTGDDPDLRR